MRMTMDHETWLKHYHSWMRECRKEWKKDSKYQDYWSRLIDIITEKNWRFRFKTIWRNDDKTLRWTCELCGPPEECVGPEIAENYIDANCGIAAHWEIEWIEIDPIIEEENDTNFPPEWVDDTEYLCEQLTSEGFEFSIIDHFIRIKTNDKWFEQCGGLIDRRPSVLGCYE